MGGVQQKFPNPVFKKINFHGKESMQEREHVRCGSPFQKRENRQVAVRIGSHEHVKVVTEEIALRERN